MLLHILSEKKKRFLISVLSLSLSASEKKNPIKNRAREQMLCAGHLKKKKKMVRCHKVGGIALTIVCKLKVRRPFSSLSREMLTFSRLIQHNPLALRKHYLNGPPCTRSTLVGTATTNCQQTLKFVAPPTSRRLRPVSKCVILGH